MKAFLGISVAAAIFLHLPAVAQQSNNSGMSDDGIYTPSGAPAPAGQPTTPAPQAASQNNTATQPMGPADNADSYARPDSNTGNTYTTTNNYYSDDYNDYGYAARLRRYDNDWGNWGYYDDVYTNSYWYSYNPYQFGMSIYMGYPWWGYSSYMYSFYPSAFWGFGWGWGGYPYFGCGYGYGGWGGGYWPCGNYGYGGLGYYNTYDRNSGFSGGLATTGGVPVGGPTAKGGPVGGPHVMSHVGPVTGPEKASFASMYQNSVHGEAIKNPSAFVKSSNGTLHVAPAVATSHSIASSRVSNMSRPTASYRGNPGMNTNATRSAASYASHSNPSAYNNNSRSNERPDNSNRGGYSRNNGYANYNSSRIAPNQGSRSSGNYNYHPSNSGSRSYGGASHSFGGGASHVSGGGHSFGGGFGGGHSSGGGFGGGHSSGGGGGHSGGGHR